MKLLVLTQKVDKYDDVLGFMHHWLEVFSDSFESITVICLSKGEVVLPQNVHVLSLGKEEKRSRFQYIWKFFTYIWQERKNYDVVLVHMNKEYVNLGALLWRMLGKKIIMWYNHPNGTGWAKLAGVLADKILYTSSRSFFSKSPKAEQMPVGIDTEFFKPDATIKRQEAMLFLGRIAPVKNVDILIEAAELLEAHGNTTPIHIYGNALPRDAKYLSDLQKRAEPLVQKGRVKFFGGIPNTEAPALFREYRYFVNLTPSGSFDKTIIEAMSSGSIVVASNRSFEEMVEKEYDELMVFKEQNAEDLAKKVITLSILSQEEKDTIGEALRTIVTRQHSLMKLKARLEEVTTA